MKYILWLIIALAVVAVCVKKVRDFRNGKYCSCNCDGCTTKCGKAKKL